MHSAHASQKSKNKNVEEICTIDRVLCRASHEARDAYGKDIGGYKDSRVSHEAREQELF